MVKVDIVKKELPAPRNKWADRLLALKDGEAMAITGPKKDRERARLSVLSWARRNKDWRVITRTDGDTLTIWKVPK